MDDEFHPRDVDLKWYCLALPKPSAHVEIMVRHQDMEESAIELAKILESRLVSRLPKVKLDGEIQVILDYE